MKEGWKYVEFGDILTIKHGKDYKDVPSKNSTYPVYGSGDDIVAYVDEYLCEGDTIILGRKGTIDKPRYMTHRYWNIDTAFSLTPHEGFSAKYIYYNCLTIDWKSLNSGAAKPSLTQALVYSQMIQVPPTFAEQQRIVEHLDSAFAKIDALKANAEKMVEEAKALFASALKEAMTPKEGWEEKTLRDILTIKHGKDYKDVPAKNSTYPVYGSGDEIVSYVDDYLCEGDTIILGRKGTIDKPRYMNHRYWNIDTAFSLTPNEGFSAKYIYYNCLTIDWKSLNSGAAKPSLTQALVYSQMINVPSTVTDQHRIVSHLDDLSAKVRQLEANYKKVSEECDALKQAILRETFE